MWARITILSLTVLLLGALIVILFDPFRRLPTGGTEDGYIPAIIHETPSAEGGLDTRGCRGQGRKRCTDTPTATKGVNATVTPEPLSTDTPRPTSTSQLPTFTPPGTVGASTTPFSTATPPRTNTPQPAATRTPTSPAVPTNTVTRTSTPPALSCTLYAAPSGAGTACTSGSPCSLDTANSRMAAGNTLCLMPGTYNRGGTFVPHGGSASGVATYRGTTGNPTDVTLRQSSQGEIISTQGNSYITIADLGVDGAGSNYYSGVSANQNSHHITVRNVYARGTGEAGIYAFHADYVTFDHNIVFHNGYDGYGWASGIGMNVSSHFNDADTGFHYIFTNNIIAGEYDSSSNHTDGNGIIVDGGYSTAYTPRVLIANNVVYSNGGACYVIYERTGGHWVVNNTCYKNALDLQLCGMGRGCFAESALNQTRNNTVVNNIARAWDIQHPYNDSNATGDLYDHNLRWGNGSNNMGNATVRTMINADPRFVNPPPVSDAIPCCPGQGWFRDALNPLQLGNGLDVQAGSPAINGGVDPRTLTQDGVLQSQLGQYASRSITGVQRPQGGGWDLGAYEHP